jgi:hypothetical protein
MVVKTFERIDRHQDGSIKAKGYTIDGVLTGYWGSEKAAQKYALDTLNIANGWADGRPVTPGERSSK